MQQPEESATILEFREWVKENGAHIHPNLYLGRGAGGLSMFTRGHIEKDTKIVSCPLDLVITANKAQKALGTLFKNACPLNEREAICTYVALQACILEQGVESIRKQPADVQEAFNYLPYIALLPRESLSPIYFSPEELELLRGTNLYLAVRDRHAQWQQEWKRSKEWLELVNIKWAEQFTWDAFLLAQSWLSSRAFPSSLLDNPPLLNGKGASPMLVPLLDFLNHARGTPVSWAVDSQSPDRRSQLSIVMHKTREAGDEIFNNYGPKPNDELLLGYGFIIPNNPDDTMLLKLPGNERRYKIGRAAVGEAEAVWGEIGRRLQEEFASDGDDIDVMQTELELEIGQILPEMLHSLQNNLPILPNLGEGDSPPGVRPQVHVMINEYVNGQRQILDDLLAFSDKKMKAAINKARELGIEITLESDEDD